MGPQLWNLGVQELLRAPAWFSCTDSTGPSPVLEAPPSHAPL